MSLHSQYTCIDVSLQSRDTSTCGSLNSQDTSTGESLNSQDTCTEVSLHSRNNCTDRLSLHSWDTCTDRSLPSQDTCNDGVSVWSSRNMPCRHFLSDNCIYVVEKCMSSMQMGTQMVKLRGGSKGLVRFYFLDEHKSCIRWRPSRKSEKAKISIDSVREVCEGKQSEIFQRYSEGSFDPNCCFSLYYGEHMESLDLVCGTAEDARTWITGLKYLMAGISDEDSLAKRQRTRDQWLKQTFTEADKNGDGSLSISEVLQLLHKLNVNLPRQKVKQMFKEADTDDNQGTLDFEEFCSFYKMMSTRRDLYLLLLSYSNHKDHLDAGDLARFLETQQKMTKVNKDHCLEIINKFEPCSENQKQEVLGIDGFTNYMRSPAGDIFNPEHYSVTQDMSQPLCNYFIASSHNTYLMGDQLMSQSRVDMYAWVLQAGCRCVEVDCWDGQDGEPIVHHGYTLTSKILFKDVIETINKYAFVKNDYPVILSIENHCTVPQQKKMAQYLVDILGDKLDLSNIRVDELACLPSPEMLRGKILVKGKKLPPNIDQDAEEGDVSDEDSADEMEDDCKLLNGDTSANRKQVENLAKKKLDNLMKESKIRDREDPDSFTIMALSDKTGSKGKLEDGTDTDETNPSSTKPSGRSFIGSFSKRKKKTRKMKKMSSVEDTDTDQESSSSASRAPPHNKKKKTMKLSRALSDLVKYTRSVGLYDIDTQANCSWQVSSLSETKAHQVMQQKPIEFIHFNQRQLSRIYPSSYRIDSSNFNPQPFWNAGCQLVALNYQSEGRVLQLNRAKFYSNGNCGYILKPMCMSEGAFNPNLDDPMPGQMKKQLVLKVISGQQLPKPKDSMLGDRGEIIDPFVEVEIIGVPVDCCKEQTRVVDDNGFNPMWEETLVFVVHMPDLALVRFLVWDHDPIGQDFIGQRTIAFNSMLPGYRHVYLEGMEEASIFVHVAVHDITGKAKAATGIKGLFHRNPKQSSLDSTAAVQQSRKHPFGSHLLRRTASAPTKGQPKTKKGFPEVAIDTKDYSSEGASDERESASQPTLPQQHNGDSHAAPQAKSPWDHPGTNGALHPDESKDWCIVLTPAHHHAFLLQEPDITVDRCLPLSVSLPEDSMSSLCSRPFAAHVKPLPYPSGAPHSTRDVSGLSCVSHENNRGTKQLTSLTHLNSSTPKPMEYSTALMELELSPLEKNGPEQQRCRRAKPLEPSRSPAIPTSPLTTLPTPPALQPQRALCYNAPPRTPVRRTKSEGYVQTVGASGGAMSVVPQVCTDATLCDRLWSKLDPPNRDSMSSSSSVSSSDTVIDLSLPNLSRQNLPWPGHPHTPLISCSSVTKSKSNPNLQQTLAPLLPCSSAHITKSNPNLQQTPVTFHTAKSGPLQSSADSPSRLSQRRHTWSRLFMEELLQSGGPPATASMSKSLGDLTSDDISPRFDSKYRSISRSFVLRPSRDALRWGRPGPPADTFTTQLRRLTDVEPLTAADLAPPIVQESQECSVDEGLVRRASSRSQSRVRYIANRAKKAQERQRLQGLCQGSTVTPIEERGNPEGACCVTQSPCSSLDLLSQLAPLTPRGPQPSTDPDSGLCYMFKL
ncbi:1-phosphatidylinositol 4,5-bisphosphate phosphodiesterase eta-2a [Periophthalmus magnuspinnatus]|uniref:1-phosphatidylinositol 4,5-bisphosphate phosphodiesterase eta-2a n=1 Tax=Periophthalmus magnuspinnatus TaxID=409849 RepID=UPI0024363861|nr:1-phosphatidylinositol 4,5-bisphosphate phosphodiesterase eta-2a [Periophthalmus magnuspinnatus]